MPSSTAAIVVLVSIHVPPDVLPDFSATAVRSCNTALGEKKCALDDGETGATPWQATVSPSGPNLDSVRIEVRGRSPEVAPETREVSFAPEDSLRERWASVGVLVAALVVAASREPEPEPAPPATVAPPPPKPPEVRVESNPPPRALPSGSLRIDLRALVAHRTTEAEPEIGAEIGASYLPGRGRWFAGIAAAGAHRLGTDLEASWLSSAFSIGARAGAPTARIAGEFRVALTGEYWLFQASELGLSEMSGHFRVGGVTGADLLWAVHPRWILSFGIEWLFVGPRLRVDVGGRTVEHVPEYGALVAAGIRVLP